MFQLSNTFLCLTGIGSIVMLSLIPSIYKNRYKIIISIFKKLIALKNKYKSYQKNSKDKNFYIKDLLIKGKYIDYYKKINNNNIEVIYDSIKPLVYYKDIVTFMLSYKICNEEYCFVRKNYIENCFNDFNLFLKDIDNNYDQYEDLSSQILNAELKLENNESIDITDTLKMMEGLKKDFNCECIYINDILNYLNYHIIDKEIESKFLKIELIDFLANEHTLYKNDKFVIKENQTNEQEQQEEQEEDEDIYEADVPYHVKKADNAYNSDDSN